MQGVKFQDKSAYSDKLYMFGGFSKGIYNELRVLYLNNYTGRNPNWRLIDNRKHEELEKHSKNLEERKSILGFNPLVSKMGQGIGNLLLNKVDQNYFWPQARFAHTFIAFDDKLVLFGGAGPYLKSINMRTSFNDVCIFDTKLEKWWSSDEDIKEEKALRPPAKRMNHAADLFGSLLVIHAGYNTEAKTVLEDFAAFDVELKRWVQLYIHDFQGQLIPCLNQGKLTEKDISKANPAYPDPIIEERKKFGETQASSAANSYRQ